MDTNKPMALRLADKYEHEGFLSDHKFAQNQWCSHAAVELRRLHSENESLSNKLQTFEALGCAVDDLQLLRMGYASARLEIASLKVRAADARHDIDDLTERDESQRLRIAELEAQLEAIGAGGVEPLRKRECMHHIAEPAPLNKATAEHALRRILHIVQRYLPPDGIAIDKAMNEIIAVVDPWPVADGGAGMYPPIPRATMFSTVLDGGFAIGNVGVYTPDQMRAYADATSAARAAAPADAPVVLPEPAVVAKVSHNGAAKWDVEFTWPVGKFEKDGVHKLYTEQQVRAMLATATGLPAQAALTWRGGNMTVADLVNNLLMMDQSLPIYGAQNIEHPQGCRRVIAIPPTVSCERVKDSRWIGEGDELNAAIIWTRAEQPAQAVPAPGVPSDSASAVREACGKIIKTLAAIVNSPQSDDQLDNEVLQRDPVMAKVMEIKSQVDAIYKAVPLPIHPYMQRQQAAAPAQDAPVDADTGRLNWLERHSDGFYNLDRISSIVGKGFLTGLLAPGLQTNHATLREAIDAARAAQGGV